MAQEFKDRKGVLHSKPKGTPIYTRISAYGIAKRCGKFLLVEPPWKDWFELPGGGIERNESVIKGLKREFLDETGFPVDVVSERAIDVKHERFYADDTDRYYYSTLLFFLVRITGEQEGNMVDRRETKALSWLNLAELEKSVVNPTHLDVLKRIEEVG
jgi:8-oxo-dGTP pyrophosphatase MutT (NUDIX family)